MPGFTVLLDDPATGDILEFGNQVGLVQASDMGGALKALETLRAAQEVGHWVAGWFGYELGYALEKRLMPLSWPGGRPLLKFGIFDRVRRYRNSESDMIFRSDRRAYAGPLALEWSAQDYRKRFDAVKAYIAAGDIYQANLTFRAHFPFLGDPRAFYQRLRKQAGARYCAYLDDGTEQILSLSPELFFSLSSEGELSTRPMKGTMARGADAASDAVVKARLRASEKDRAENLMIVDLLRNDLGRVAETGSVHTHDLFAVETYPTLHQMVSSVQAKLLPEKGIDDLIRALFPSGSVTGAPKIRAMEIIRELEQSPRGVYCGAIGCVAPDGASLFNVAIRTLTLSRGRGELGIGGAVVQDSDGDAEYRECLLKADFFQRFREPVELFETMAFHPGEGIPRLELHLDRIAASAERFAIAFDRDAARALLENHCVGKPALRLRLALDEQGNLALGDAPLPPSAALWRYTVSRKRLPSDDELARHKTNWRTLYDEEYAKAHAATGCDEILFLNEKAEIAEGSRSNIFVHRDGQLLTPPLAAGILGGVLRRALLERGEAREAVLTEADLSAEVFFGNSLRGLIPAQRI